MWPPLIYEQFSVFILATPESSAPMENNRLPTETMRKSPQQDRAVKTIGALLDAAAQILQRDGEQGFTTNKVAERAGFSIGTLYQYFPNKEAIIAGLAGRERRIVEAQLHAVLAAAKPGSQAEAVRQIVRILIRAFSGRRRARRFVVLASMRGGRFETLQKANQDFIEAIVSKLTQTESAMQPLTPAMAFVLTRAVQGVIRSAVLEEDPLLETREFEDELVLLAMGYLRQAR